MTTIQDTTQPRLPLARYRLSFRTVDPIRLPDYAGSAWRGVFGHALKRLVRVTRQPACPECLLYRSCVFPYLFETAPDPEAGKMRKYNAAPRPFTLDPDAEARGALPPGAGLSLEVTLFGHANRHLPYIVHALDQAGRRGIGKRGGHLLLERVDQEADIGDWRRIFVPGGRLTPAPAAVPATPPCPSGFDLVLKTPLRIKAEGHHLTPETFRFSALFSNLLRRISMLSTFHTDTPLETDFAGLSRAARRIATEQTQLRWHEWKRYSSRQDALLQMGGLLGRMTLAGSDLEPFWPYLWLGQWTHAGKGTSMGLGRYGIDIINRAS